MKCPRYEPGIHEMHGEQHKKKNKGPKVTVQVIEDELDHLAQCFENKRQLRLAKIPEEVAQCIKVERCCKPRPTCVDFFFDRFVRELDEDDRMRRKIKAQSTCRVSNAFQKFAPRAPPTTGCRSSALPPACMSFTCAHTQPPPSPTPRTAPSTATGKRDPQPQSSWQGQRQTPSNGLNAKSSCNNMNRKPLRPKSPYEDPRKTPSNGPNRKSSPHNMYCPPSNGPNEKSSLNNMNRKPPRQKSPWQGPRKTFSSGPSAKPSPNNMNRKSPYQGRRKTSSNGKTSQMGMYCPPSNGPNGKSSSNNMYRQSQGAMPRKVGSTGPYGAAGMGPSGSSGYQEGREARQSQYQGINGRYSSGSPGSAQWGTGSSTRGLEDKCMDNYPCK